MNVFEPHSEGDHHRAAILDQGPVRGQPAVDACDEAMRSRLPVEIRAEAAHKKGVELGELTRYGDAVKAYRAAIRLKPSS